ncbi:hypothetical protein E8E12_004791 [Didymella heteroderae]|uniref:ATP binding n=1 Tax=Didymella heteroderae TaxID=1769908 RepID=A0A9P4WR68_9PLEO|nr:hypothetical protein E8E12_004791 [Didymella heteroderae]
MSDDVNENQTVPVQNDSNGMDEHYEENWEFDFNLDEPNASTDDVDDQISADDAAHAILPQDDAAYAHQVLGLEGFQEIDIGQEERHEVYESVEDDLEPESQPLDHTEADTLEHADADLEPEQQAQRTSHEPIDNDEAMEDAANAPDVAETNTTVAISRPNQHNADVNDSSSLFIPERYTLSHYPAPVPLPPRMNAAPPRHTLSPTRSTGPNFSVFSKVREMQKAARERKAALRRATPTRISQDADPQTYLDAVTAGIRPPAGAFPQPAVEEDEMAHRVALAKFQKQKMHYEKLKFQNGGRLGFRHDVEWMRIQGAEHARIKKRQRELAEIREGDEQDLFPPVRNHAGEQEDESDNNFYGEDSSRKRRRGEQPRKQDKPQSLQEAELRAMRVALEADEDINPKKTKSSANKSDPQPSQSASRNRGSTSKSSRAPQTKAVGKAAKGSRKTAKDKRELENATRQATSLFNANVFEQQAGMGAADQPTFRTRNKADALKELIASVPIADKKQIRNDMNTLLQASKDFDGRGACKIAPGNNGNWLVRGMKTSLKGYQILGTAFMRRRENDDQEPRGGLMADQMGLGKTLMMLANIVNSRDAMIRTKDSGPKTTLLVASPALLNQWAAEIKQHTELGLRTMQYGSGKRIDSSHAIQMMNSHDIILTSYTEVMKSYPKNEPPIECQTAEQKIEWWKETYSRQRGVLHQMHFKRIVLDEAQAIKNHKSRTSVACRGLIATHKWALSGTPILNGLDELYPYFKFLNVPHTGSLKIFKNNYCGNGDGENAERLLVRLSQFMIRRTHADRMFNAPILKLPQANESTYWCEFNSVERCIYIIVHQRFAARINMWSQKGTLDRAYNNVLVMLLRLRQLTAHILMLQFVMGDLLEREDIERIKEVVREQAASSNIRQGRTILSIRKQLEAYELREKRKAAIKAAKRAAAEEAAKNGAEYVEPESDDDDGEDDAPVQVPQDGEAEAEEVTVHRGVERNKSGKAFGKSYNFKPYVNSLTAGESWEKKKERAKCGECGKRPYKPWKTACGHLICSEPCYEEVINAAAEEGKAHGTCKACGQTFYACTPCDEEEDDDVPTTRGTRSRAAAREKKRKERFDREDIAGDWLSLGGEEVLPSAKTIAVKAQVLNWIRENPSVKIIIYTQFLAMIRILTKICEREGWKTEQYHGKLSLVARNKAIEEFASNDQSRILLASLRCGGLGLNLTMASKVIIIDPWWNQASEQQAFCRVFRIGQQGETSMTRMCVKDTVDERLIEMQKTKQKEIDEIMDDRGKRTKNLEIADVMRLFGNIEEDGEGKPFILVENPDAAGGFHADQDHEGYADEF